MTYAKLTKSQLIDRINELERQSLAATLTSVTTEIKLLGKDILAAVAFTYNAGAQFRKQLTTLRLFK